MIVPFSGYVSYMFAERWRTLVGVVRKTRRVSLALFTFTKSLFVL